MWATRSRSYLRSTGQLRVQALASACPLPNSTTAAAANSSVLPSAWSDLPRTDICCYQLSIGANARAAAMTAAATVQGTVAGVEFRRDTSATVAGSLVEASLIMPDAPSLAEDAGLQGRQQQQQQPPASCRHPDPDCPIPNVPPNESWYGQRKWAFRTDAQESQIQQHQLQKQDKEQQPRPGAPAAAATCVGADGGSTATVPEGADFVAWPFSVMCYNILADTYVRWCSGCLNKLHRPAPAFDSVV